MFDELPRARDDAVEEGFPESINPQSAIRNPQSKSAGLLEIRLHQPDSFKSGQRSHLGIYLAHKRAVQWRRKQCHEQSFDLGGAFDSGADRDPVEFEQLSGQNPSPAGFQQQLTRVVVIPGEMPALLFGDPLAENLEDRVASEFLEVFVSA